MDDHLVSEPRVERIVVTGASRGIGRAIAERLLAHGRRVALVARDRAALDSLVRSSDGRAFAIDADLGAIDGPRSVIARAIEALGAVDALVSCAGIADHRPLAAIDEEQIDAHLAIHVRAPLILARDLAAHLASRDASGAIVTVASTLALSGAPGTSVYAAAKGAVIAMTRALAIELAPRVRVSCIAPGAVDTDMIRAPRSEDALRALAAMHPLGRLGTPEEIAEAIEWVLDARWATGSIVVLDGGISAA